MRLRKKITLYFRSKILIILFLIFICTYFFLSAFTKKSLPYLYAFAKNESINMTSALINKAIYEEIYSGYDKDVVLIEKNDKDEIVDIRYDTQKLNMILFDISDNILGSIDSLRKGDIDKLNFDYYNKDSLVQYVPIGIMYNIPILVNISPKIPYRISYVGSIDSSVNTKITEYGINNALIETVLNVNMNVRIIFPLLSETVTVDKNIPIYSNVIQGKIPTYYGGIITNSSPISSK